MAAHPCDIAARPLAHHQHQKPHTYSGNQVFQRMTADDPAEVEDSGVRHLEHFRQRVNQQAANDVPCIAERRGIEQEYQRYQHQRPELDQKVTPQITDAAQLGPEPVNHRSHAGERSAAPAKRGQVAD